MEKDKEKDIARAVGKVIARKRLEKGLTQEQVAEQLDIGYEAVSRIERGTAIPNVIRLIELADIFECGTDELLIHATSRPADYVRHLQKLFEPLSKQDRLFLVNIMEKLANRLQKDRCIG